MRRSIPHRLLGVLCAVAVTVLVAHWPVTTRYGVNYQQYKKRIPLYEKALNFLSRDVETRRLAHEVTRGAERPEDRLLTILSWVHEHVQPIPPGFPVVDDHMWNVLVRGYGTEDQRTGAFVLLASYSGLSAAATVLWVPGHEGRLSLGIVRSQGRALVFDVVHQIVFRNEHGELASMEDLLRNPALVTNSAPGLMVNGVSYPAYFAQLQSTKIRFFQMGNQHTVYRLRSELLKLVGLGREPVAPNPARD